MWRCVCACCMQLLMCLRVCMCVCRLIKHKQTALFPPVHSGRDAAGDAE